MIKITHALRIFVVILILSTFLVSIDVQASDESCFVSKMNASRAAAGLPAMESSGSLASFARTHSADMLAAGNIYHSSNLASAASGWEALAENVGVGPTCDSLHNAFMNSPGHKRNILGNYNHVGVGVVTDGGTIWVTVVFMRKGAPTPTTTTTTTTAPTTTTVVVTSTTKPQATTTTTSPKQTTTSTTSPRTTTTNMPQRTTTTTSIPQESSTTSTTLAAFPVEPTLANAPFWNALEGNAVDCWAPLDSEILSNSCVIAKIRSAPNTYIIVFAWGRGQRELAFWLPSGQVLL